jgi:thioredoxin reductase (NADPH)
MTENLGAFAVASLVTLFFCSGYLRQLKNREKLAHEAVEKGKLRSDGPKAQHPHIDISHCIGCATCTTVCPEGDVLAMLGGKAALVNGHKCIGHGLCAEACPVGAITMVMASASAGAEMPYLTPEYETTVPNMFIVGELGGLALIKNAVRQGKECVDTITGRLSSTGKVNGGKDLYDVLIVGAGPAGISASLRAIENGLRYLTIERDELGGTVAKYPRQKLVMTSPVEFPMYGKFKHTELSKEELLEFWNKVLHRADFNACTGVTVENIKKGEDGNFTVVTNKDHYRARTVVLALGRAGTPNKLGVKGEELPKVMYRLIEADHYTHKKLLIVGGGDSAVEAAMGLASQAGNEVTLSYRKDSFSRIKDRNEKRIAEFVRTGKLKAIFNSIPVEITADTVVLDVKGEPQQKIANDFMWVFAGGKPPNEFLRTVGVGFGMQESGTEGEPAQNAAPTLARIA